MVINTDGSLRWAASATTDFPSLNSDRIDAGIAADGRVIVVYADSSLSGVGLIQARIFSAAGTPQGAPFIVSETETPGVATFAARNPRVAWRGSEIAVIWESSNAPGSAVRSIAGRIFGLGVGTVESAGLTALSGTTYVNVPVEGSPFPLNNGKVESLGVGIAKNGNVIVGWEDDGNGLSDYEAAWTLFDKAGKQLIGDTVETTVTDGSSITSKYLSFFRADGSPTPANNAWGAKIKANLFGDGVGMGAISFSLGLEIPELADLQIQADGSEGDFPAVQLANNDGTPAIKVPLSGYSDADADVPGDIRIGDFDYLSNGNIVIVSESRQKTDLVDRFGGALPGQNITFRIVKPDGTEVKGLTLVSDSPVAGSMWHGVGVTANGFAVRYQKGNDSVVRLFKNDGTPVTGDIKLADLGGSAVYGGGGRGDGAGFHGNGVDAYVAACTSKDPDTGVNHPYLMVINTDGSLRWAASATSDFPTLNSDRIDAGIAADGRVVVVYADSSLAGVGLVQARLFNADGSTHGEPFIVSETEAPGLATFAARNPRVAWRDNQIAVIWESSNAPGSAVRSVALRVLSLPSSGTSTSNLKAALAGGKLVLTWDGSGTLESAAELAGPWTSVTGATSPANITPDGAHRFFRVK